MKGPNVRWKTEDGELIRIRRRAPGESPLGCGSGCSAADLFAPAEDLFAPAGESAAGGGNSMLRLADVCSPPAIAPAAGEMAGSARDSVGSAGEPLPPRYVRPLGVGSRLLGGPPARSGHGPAPSPIESFAPRLVRHLRRSARLLGRQAALIGVEDARGGIRPPASGTGMSAPAPACPLGSRALS
jgi:hypothetical protein